LFEISFYHKSVNSITHGVFANYLGRKPLAVVLCQTEVKKPVFIYKYIFWSCAEIVISRSPSIGFVLFYCPFPSGEIGGKVAIANRGIGRISGSTARTAFPANSR
jgi:hypothetical protein